MKHNYPKDLVLKVLQEEIQIICSQNVGKVSLKNVSIITFAKNQSHINSQSTGLSDAHLRSPDLTLQPSPNQTIGATRYSQADPLLAVTNTDNSMR